MDTHVTPDDVVGYAAVSEDQLRRVHEVIGEKLFGCGFTKQVRDKTKAAYFLREGEDSVLVDALRIRVPDLPEYEAHGLRVVFTPYCPRDIGNIILAAIVEVTHLSEPKVESALEKEGVTYGFVSLRIHRSGL